MIQEASPDVSSESQNRSAVLVTANDTHPQVPGLRKSTVFDAHAFHLNKKERSDLLPQLKRFLNIDIGRKARILSTDGVPRVSPSLLREMLREIPKDGSVAFEHFDEPWSRTLKTAYIPAEKSWPPKSDEGEILGLRAKALGDWASPLQHGGRLSVQGRSWRWNGKPVRLAGLSVSYGLLSTTRHELAPMLDFLQKSKVNFMRVWVTEQWTSLVKLDDRKRPGQATAIAPWVWKDGKYHLNQRNSEWLTRLETLLKLAAERGIAVQVSLVDWCGLRNSFDERGNPKPGYWSQSPYNPNNSTPAFLPAAVPKNRWPNTFTKLGSPFWNTVLEPLIRDVAQVVGRHSNALIEIANEPRGKTMTGVLGWHQKVRQVVVQSTCNS